MPYDALDDARDIRADILRPSLRTEDFDEEKGVILEEIAMYDDQPFWVLFEQGLERYFGDHPLAHRVLGTRQTVGDLQRDQMQAYFDRRYSADNGVLVASGRVDFDELVARAETLCGHWPKGEPGRVHVEPTFEPGELEVDLPDTQQRYIMLLAPAVGIADPRKYAMAQAFQALGDSDGSTFFWELVETGLAEERDAIAGVFVRRLNLGMRLQTDPTVIYGMGDSYQGNIRRSDLKRRTPYNTYRIKGLPPTPIAMPSAAAINAALHPLSGSSLYFVARGDGGHYFSDSLEEHLRAVKQYQIRNRVQNYQSAPPTD